MLPVPVLVNSGWSTKMIVRYISTKLAVTTTTKYLVFIELLNSNNTFVDFPIFSQLVTMLLLHFSDAWVLVL